jgi:hypothetical protein
MAGWGAQGHALLDFFFDSVHYAPIDALASGSSLAPHSSELHALG